jgi:hypothetical protein
MSVGEIDGRQSEFWGDAVAYLQSHQIPLDHERIVDELYGFRVSEGLKTIRVKGQAF